jgi:iron-sulfur cluster assembly accessory protein
MFEERRQNRTMQAATLLARSLAIKPRKQLMQITPQAAERVKSLIDSKDPPKPIGIRLGVKNRGCSGQSYTMDYAHDGNTGKYDEVIKSNGVTVFVDANAQMFLVNTVMDFKEDDVHQGFVFENPNVAVLLFVFSLLLCLSFSCCRASYWLLFPFGAGLLRVRRECDVRQRNAPEKCRAATAAEAAVTVP